MKKKIHTGIAFLVLILLSVLFYHKQISEFPRYIHAWSQGDRYALALGFQDNGFDLFHPQTFNLNPQFSAEQPLEVEEGITRVDFPIHEFMVGGLMSLTGSQAPLVFRSYILIVSLLGLIFLFWTARRRHREVWPAYLIVGMVFASPVFTYYQAGFIPSIPSLAAFFVGLFFLDRHAKSDSLKDWGAAIGFLTLAALTRTPFVIFLLALTLAEAWRVVKARKWAWLRWAFLLGGFVVIGGYFLYNSYLAKTYGSVFLGRPQAPQGLGEMRDILLEIKDKWLWHYLTIFHLLVFGGLILLAFWPGRKMAHESRSRKGDLLGGMLFFAAGGVVLYSALMARQFRDHDYYFLDTWLPLSVLFLLCLLPRIPTLGHRQFWLPYAGVVLLSAGMLYQSGQTQVSRKKTGRWDATEVTTQNFMGSEAWLDSLGVSKEAKILVLDAYSPNLPFILMDRKGYAVISTQTDSLQQAMDYRFDWVVLQDTYRFPEVVDNYPALLDQLEFEAGNGKISLYRRGSSPVSGGRIGRFAGWQGSLLYEKTFVYDTLDMAPMWSGSELLSHHCDPDSSQVLGIPRDREFGAAFEMKVGESLPGTPSGIAMSFRFFTWEFMPKAWWAVQIERGKQTIYYHKYPINRGERPGSWRTRHYAETLPEIKPGDIVKAYVWNEGEHAFCVDDVHLELYGSKEGN